MAKTKGSKEKCNCPNCRLDRIEGKLDEMVFKLRNKESMQTVLAAREPKKLSKVYRLTHAESGEGRRYEQEWQIFVENGRGPDKAVAAALTASLSYFLRDLLLIPRVNTEDELDADHGEAAQQREQEQAQEQAQRNAENNEKINLMRNIGAEVKRLGLNTDDVAEWCREFGADNPRKLSNEDLKLLLEKMLAVPDDTDGSDA